MKDILIVEDNKVERDKLHALFESKGYSVVACEKAEVAENQARLHQFNLAILDIGLGDKSGSSLFSILRQSRRVAHTIILTGNPSVALKQRLIADGVAAYLIKGSPQGQPEALLVLVDDLIGKPRTQKLEGIPLLEFLERCIPDRSRALFFYGEGESFPLCSACGHKEYQVVFGQEVQCPPELKGIVVCSACGALLDPKV